MRIVCPVSTAIKAIVAAFFIGLIIGLTIAAKAATATPPAHLPAPVDQTTNELWSRTGDHHADTDFGSGSPLHP